MATIEVEALRLPAGGLVLRYCVTGTVRDLRLPTPGPLHRTDELWRHTCFEAFVCVRGGSSYCELNFAPSRQWAAYRFTGYRTGMANADIAPPGIETRENSEQYEMTVKLEHLPGFSDGAAWRVGLSAVIEDSTGRKSYWALAHPPGKPDFHHADCFALALPAPSRP